MSDPINAGQLDLFQPAPHGVIHRLPTRFISYGFEFEIIDRRDRVVLLKKRRVFGAKNVPRLSQIVTFEVVALRIRKETVVYGRVYERRETMPSPREWGTAGWTYINEADARRKFDEQASKRCPVFARTNLTNEFLQEKDGTRKGYPAAA